MHLQLKKEFVEISHVTCPGGECIEDGRCVVEWFLMRFGLECNVGVCPAAADLEIAWSLTGDKSDFDVCQVWVIPVDDEAFSAWLGMQSVG